MSITATTISKFLQFELYGPDLEIHAPKAIHCLTPGSLTFASRYSEENLSFLNKHNSTLALVADEFRGKIECSYICIPNPRLAFARVLEKFFSYKPLPRIAPTAVIGKNVLIGAEVSIGEYVVIENNVEIGDRSIIHHHVVIGEGTSIGHDCIIKSNSVIGQDGFGFAIDENSRPVRIPHLGKVQIGNFVEIGALNTVVRATLEKTIIDDFVKTDDHVHIAHNDQIGENSMLTACAELSGSVKVGKNVWIGPNSSIIDNITIGDDAMIGIGTVIRKKVEPNTVVAGSPAKILRKRHLHQ